MKPIRFFRFVKDIINNPDRDFYEQIFLLYSIFSEFASIVALVGDIVMKEHIGEIITLIGVVIAVPLVTFICLHREKIKTAVSILVVMFCLLIFPALFFFGGGLTGGGVIWLIFGFMYVGLSLTGVFRKLILGFLLLESFVCYVVAYYYPQYVTEHSRKMFFVDSYISLIMVGSLCFLMTWSQNRLLRRQTDRAQKEAQRAEELTRSQNRFFSSMSHEIRTPINSILGLNELILRDQKATDEIIRDAVGIQGSGKMLLALINDILDFSKMEADSMEILPVDYRVADMISEIVNMIWVKAQDKGLKLEVNIDPGVPAVLYGDEVRIRQILINLLNNAVKYTQDGSVDLQIESKMIDAQMTELTITVTDTGMGIKKESLPYLFDAFKRLEEEKNRLIEGTGLGLSIVKQLVDLMEGTISVSSVYGEGSTFTVTLRQGVSDAAPIGSLRIHNQQLIKRSHYESSFKAPDARVLIVDDNVMNLEVEKKLLVDTRAVIDTAESGREALELALRVHYDVILMDHLMPEMDGIECLKGLRNQTGGMNRTTPVIVLTANAGSDNRDLYSRAGFDSYLMKPVSGQDMEEVLIRHIPRDKLILSGKLIRLQEDINTVSGFARKEAVIITTTSMSDLPHDIVEELKLPILPFLIRTQEGVFKDGEQMDANELIRYINSGKRAVSSPPDVNEYTEFFANALKRAHHLIHISLTTSMSEDYHIACEAARSFDNVTVINSECLSSATGLLVLIAEKLVGQNIPVEEIVKELEEVKRRLRCSFVIDTTDYMVKKGLLGKNIHKIAKNLNLHPGMHFKDDRSILDNIWVGNREAAYKKYIRKAFPIDVTPDPDVLFITYADLSMETLSWIREEVGRIAYFEHVIFQPASAAITSNCGPGSFGLLYFEKSGKSYNIGSFIPERKTEEEEEKPEIQTDPASRFNREPEEPVLKWYQKIEGIDPDEALENSGSEEAFETVARIYYDAYPEKVAELNAFYDAKDLKNYTIRIHALKSSSKLIGATELARRAENLEMAGKEGDADYIDRYHKAFVQDYGKLRDLLGEALFMNESEEEETEEEKPVADADLMETVYEELGHAAVAMDLERMEQILQELDAYSIPENEQERFAKIRESIGRFDYEGVEALLSEQ